MDLVVPLLICLAIPNVVDSLSQADIDNIAAKLQVRYKVVDNLAAPTTFRADITLTNNGDVPIKGGDWSVYFCSIRKVANTAAMNKQTIKFEHINGCLHKFYPTSEFKDLSPGTSLTLEMTAAHWVIARSDVMPNWYVTSPGTKAKTIESTHSESLSFVDDFVTKEQWKRFVNDKYDPYTAKTRYDIVEIDGIEDKDMPLVIPHPLNVAGLDRGNQVQINKEWKIYADKALEKQAKLLSDKFQAAVVTSPPSESSKVIRVSLGDPDVTANGAKSTSGEAYSLDIDASSETITVIGKTSSGVFYGVQTLLALADKKNTVPKVTIKDAPRYGYRGMHLDVGRNFMPKLAVLRLLDVMSMYKLNKFHFHLTDDEGWRLEIPGLPELTTIGSKRCYDTTGDKCIQTDLGSSPDEPSTATHYTVSDYKDILQYANDRHIQVIPEFDMPGHGYAAIKSMEARSRKLNRTGDVAGASKYSLTEAGDPSKYLSIQMFTDDAINPCLESTYTFVDHIVNEVVRMHSDKQPLTIYHFGGDEVAHGAWQKSTSCRDLSQQRGLNFSASDIVDKLKDYFVQRVANITVKYNLSLAGWEDGLLGKGDIPYDRSFIANTDVYAYAWNNIWEWGGGKRAYELANAGYKVIMTQATHLYFDHPQEPDPEERGYYWATRFTDTPTGFYTNQKFAFLQGMAGALWTETVRTADQMDSMIYPRLLALAERAWYKASWEDLKDDTERNKKRLEDWRKFANVLGHRELARLDELGVKYYVPPPGASHDEPDVFIDKIRTSIHSNVDSKKKT
ncbi:hypothetical protein QZH41_007366 [Actinostola sp. cb2023]|nr:hypothetical protein QZH41_007366 [Actinostola sp. cb2023]